MSDYLLNFCGWFFVLQKRRHYPFFLSVWFKCTPKAIQRLFLPPNSDVEAWTSDFPAAEISIAVGVTVLSQCGQFPIRHGFLAGPCDNKACPLRSTICYQIPVPRLLIAYHHQVLSNFWWTQRNASLVSSLLPCGNPLLRDGIWYITDAVMVFISRCSLRPYSRDYFSTTFDCNHVLRAPPRTTSR